MLRLSIVASLVFVFACGLAVADAMAQDPAPKPTRAEAPKIINGGVLNGKARELPMPEYPEDARSKGIGGKVVVAVTIDESGNVISAHASVEDLKLSDNPENSRRDEDPLTVSLRTAGENAARMATFTPTLLSGAPVKITGSIVYSFDPETGKVGSPPRQVSGGILNGRAESLPTPGYPPAAKAVRAEGTVTVQVQIGPEGNVIYASAVFGHPLLRAAAETAARGAKFAPTLLEGKPLTVTGVLTYNFVLPKKDDQ